MTQRPNLEYPECPNCGSDVDWKQRSGKPSDETGNQSEGYGDSMLLRSWLATVVLAPIAFGVCALLAYFVFANTGIAIALLLVTMFFLFRAAVELL